MRMIKVVACCALVIVLTPLAPVSAQVLDFTTVDVPGASATLPRDINPAGDILGFYGVGAAFPNGFLIQQGTVTDFVVPGAVSYSAPRHQPSG